jgi:hypothetical protein
MRLQVNEEKSGVRQPEEVHFLGFRFRCQKDGDDVAILLSSERTAEGHHTGDDATQLEAVHHVVYGGDQPLPDRMDVALPALHAGAAPGHGHK